MQQIAPSSAHAVHMPSHIFARLGLWQEDIEANLKSVDLTGKSGKAYMRGHELHAMHFLLYAYLQTGQDDAAKRIVDKSKEIVAGATDNGPYRNARIHGLRGGALSRAVRPGDASLVGGGGTRTGPNAAAHLRTITYWARAIGSAHMNDVEARGGNVKLFDDAEEAVRHSKYAYTLEGRRSSSAHDEAHAWLAFVEHKNDEALQLMREVADHQDQAGKAEVDIPAREMLGGHAAGNEATREGAGGIREVDEDRSEPI